MIEQINENELFFEKINKIDKSLARLIITNKQKKSQHQKDKQLTPQKYIGL